MIGLFSVTLSFERDLQLFSRLLFLRSRSLFFQTKKSFLRRERENTDQKSFFHFFRLSSFLQESKKNFYFPPVRREKRDIKTQNTAQ